MLFILQILILNVFSILTQSQRRDALIKFQLHNISVDSKGTNFSCYQQVWNFTGHCNIKLFIFGCSHSLTRKSALPIFSDAEQEIYYLRYSTWSADYVNQVVYSYFQNVPDFECVDNLDGIPVYFETMEQDFTNLTHRPHLNITTGNWSQRVIFWISAWSDDVINVTKPKIWYAEFIENEKLLPFPEHEEYVFLSHVANAFGKIGENYSYVNLDVQISFSWNYICTAKGFGPICSTMCKESITTICDNYTGKAICQPGYLGVLEKTYEVFLPYILNCSAVDTCFNVDCGENVCIRFPSNDTSELCRDYKTSTEPLTKCLPVFEKVKCIMIGTLPPNYTISAYWEYQVLDDGAIISQEYLHFEEAIPLTEKYQCVITLDDLVPKQSIFNNFSFMVYDDAAIINLNIENEYVYMGQMIICSVEGWNPDLVNYTVYAGDPDTLILDRIEQNMYEVSTKSELTMNNITCIASLGFICDEKEALIRSITLIVFVQAFQKLEWYGGERNIFYRGIDENPFMCYSSLPSNAANITVTIMHQPKITENNALLNETLIPGIYYAACTLHLLDTNHTYTIYKHIHIHYFPNETELVLSVESTYFDSKMQCLPLPFPIEDYEYSITIFSGPNNFTVIGTFHQHSLERFPFSGTISGEYYVKCSMKPKHPSQFQKIEKTFKIKLTEWKDPIVFVYMNWRVWSNVFYATLLICITLLSLSWIIHMKSTSSISGDYLTKRTKVLNNLRRRNRNFYMKLLEWMEATNSYFYTVGIIPLSVSEAYKVIRTEPSITRDFFQYISGQKIDSSDLKALNEKSKFYQKTIENIRKENS